MRRQRKSFEYKAVLGLLALCNVAALSLLAVQFLGGM